MSPEAHYRNIRERDGCECVICGTWLSAGETRTCLQVHHIDRNKDNDAPSNLITLCPSCHKRIHFCYDDIIPETGLTPRQMLQNYTKFLYSE